MVTTKKSVCAAPSPSGPAPAACPASATRTWPVWLVAAGLALLAGCDAPPGERELNRGIRLLQEGQPAVAVTPLRQAVDQFTTNQVARANALNYLGLAFHQSGRLDEAARAYQAALNADLNLLEARYNRGCLLLETGDLPGALRELSTFVDLRPDSAPGWLRLGSARYQAGAFNEADQAFRRAAELSSARDIRVGAFNGAGLCRARQGRLLEAMKFFGAALQLNPAFAPARLNQAIVTEQSQDLLGALEDYQTWLETATNAPARQAVVMHVRELVHALQPRLPAIAAADARDLARLTNLFSRVGRLETMPAAPAPAAPSNPPPATVLTAAPPVVAAVSTPAPPPVVVRTAAPLPALVLTPPPPATVATSPAPAVAVARPVSTNVVQVAAAHPPKPERVKPAPEKPKPAQPVEEEVVPAAPSLVVALPPVETPVPAPPPKTEVAMVKPVAKPVRPAVRAPAPAPPAPAETVEEPPEKRSFFSRINPLNLLRREGGKKEKKPKSHGRITPLPPARDGASPNPVLTPAATRSNPPPVPTPAPPGPEAAKAIPARPAFARYAYLSPAKPNAGDAAAAQRLFTKGAEAHRAGRLDAAATAYRQAIVTDPTCVEARYNLGTLALARQEYATALQQFETALAIEPANPAARFNFALALEEAGYPLDAEAEMLRVLRVEPRNVEAHLALARLYSDFLQRPDKAREHYQQVLKLDPHHPQADMIRRWLAQTR